MVHFAWEEIKKSMEDKVAHIPVMHNEIAEYLSLLLGGVCVDANVGMGWHTGILTSHVGPM